jgi:acetyl esterase
MPLHRQCKAFLDMLAASPGPPIEQLPVEDARKMPYHMIDLGGPEEAVARVENRTLPGPAGPVPVRVYRPSLAPNLPALLFFHGGGFVLCDLETHDRQCRSLANASGCVVIAVDFRLAPEHKFPVPVEDGYAATRYVAEHPTEFGVDPLRIGVAGDSAGANMATVVALMARDRGAPSLKFQLLIYPVVDFWNESPSMEEFGANHFLTREAMYWFRDCYFATTDDARLPYGSPLLADDLRGLPPAMVVTAECDPLRDQGEAYARKLEAAGVPVTFKRYDGMIHPFFNLGGIIDAGRALVKHAAGEIRQALRATPVAGV